MATITKSPVDPDVEIIHSTFEDNPYLDDDYKEILQNLISQDENFYRIYTLGEWGLLTRRIYTNYIIIPALPEFGGGHWAYGLDFGLVNPSAIVKVILHQDKIYLEELFYKANITNSDIIEFFSHQPKGDIYADPSAKQMIAEIQRAGFNAFEGHKGVVEGINLCQRQTLYIPQSSVNLIKEISSYQWKSNKDGQVLDEPIKFNDHLLDSMRYAIWGITSRYGFATQRPRSTEPIKSLTLPGQQAGDNQKLLDKWMRRERGR